MLRLARRWSTEMPMVGASLRGIPASCIGLQSQTIGLPRESDMQHGWRYLQFCKGEATTGSNATIVLDSWASDDWSEFVDGARSHGSSFGQAGISTS